MGEQMICPDRDTCKERGNACSGHDAPHKRMKHCILSPCPDCIPVAPSAQPAEDTMFPPTMGEINGLYAVIGALQAENAKLLSMIDVLCDRAADEKCDYCAVCHGDLFSDCSRVDDKTKTCAMIIREWAENKVNEA